MDASTKFFIGWVIVVLLVLGIMLFSTWYIHSGDPLYNRIMDTIGSTVAATISIAIGYVIKYSIDMFSSKSSKSTMQYRPIPSTFRY
jgi:hypothetical protein